MKNKKNLKLENNEQFKKGFEWGKKFAEKLEKIKSPICQQMKVFFKNIMKGEKNVNI